MSVLIQKVRSQWVQSSYAICVVVPQLEGGIFQIHKGNVGPTERLAPKRDKKVTTLDSDFCPKHVDLFLVSQEMVHWC